MTLTQELTAPTATGRKRWTAEDCKFLENAGLLKGRYELLDGEIIVKMRQNAPHAIGVMNCIAYCLPLFGRLRVRSQATVLPTASLSVTNRPEPDIAALREGSESKRIPDTTNVVLIIEVCDTTQGDDYGWKTALYAQSGVAEYWVLDINRRLLVQFRQTLGDQWQERNECMDADRVTCLAAPQTSVAVADLLP